MFNITTSRNAHRIALAFLACIIATCTVLTIDASARPVSLAEAAAPATFLSNLADRHYVDAGDVTTGYTCWTQDGEGAYFSDVQAYTWRGQALGQQRWNRDHTLMYWTARDGRRVTFDGIRFVNHSHTNVIVAGWCE